MPLDGQTAVGQPKAEALGVIARIQAGELLKDSLVVRSGDAGTRIQHPDIEPLPLLVGADLDLPADRGKFNCVLQ